MPSDAAQQFIDSAERSGLIAPAVAQEALALLTVDGAVTTDKVAEHLVEKKALTAYQVEQLLAGKGEDCVIAGRYHVVDKLGEGGMGAVFKARDTKLERIVAIKVLPAGRLQDGDAVARFQREAKALARLAHPHIIQAFDSGDERGRHFLVMEYVDGVTLDKVLRQHGALAPTLAADLVHQAALGLQHAHEKGLIHRDLKPANLLVAGLIAASTPSVHIRETVDFAPTPAPQRLKPAAATVKILDLGLARFLQDQLGDAQLTQEGAGMGTPDYMAPEQFRDALHADARTDIYGLGCTLYHLIAGSVPFPGTSFSEKAQAHAKREPIPLEERCPEVPAGLAFIVQKMMAKHPAERYQSAGEVAEALAPYVAGSSHSVIRLRETGRWPPGQLTMLAPRPARRAFTWIGSAILLVLCALLLVVAWPILFPPDPVKNEPIAQIPDAKTDAPKSGDPPKPDGKPRPEPAKPKVVTIENGLTVAQDGTGQFSTINAALDKVQPGQTIRVLDSATYTERISIGSPTQHKGITLESPQGATVENKTEATFGITILGVAEVTIRGLHMKCVAKKQTAIWAQGEVPGLLLSGLEFDGDGYDGVTFGGAKISADQAPAVIENCVMYRPMTGINIAGLELDYQTPRACSRVLIRNNDISGAGNFAINLFGDCRQVFIVGNRFFGSARLAAVQLAMIEPTSKDIVIANNSFFECRPAVRLIDNGVKGEGIHFANNLILDAGASDLSYLNFATYFTFRGPADGKLVSQKWLLRNNWREPSPTDPPKSYIPFGAADVGRERIELLSRTRGEPNFLRPAKDSPLAKAGAGGDLPSYVGAVPPEGAEPWDWQWTWDAMIHQRLTVTKDPKVGGHFRTINAALDRVRPGQTIRVLDGEIYQEVLNIVRPGTQTGIVLEAVKGATLSFPKCKIGVSVSNVPRVTVRGFKLRHEAEALYMIGAGGRCQGLRLEQLDIKVTAPLTGGVTMEGIEPGGDVSTVQNCVIQGGFVGLRVSGFTEYRLASPCGSLALRNNLILESGKGISIMGCIKRVHVTGNRIAFAPLSGIQLENLLSGTEDILIANNTMLDCSDGFRVWDDGSKKDWGERIRLVNNLVLGSHARDMLFMDSGGDPNKLRGPGDGRLLLKAWHWESNWRETQGPKGADVISKSWIPVAPADKRQDKIDVLSRVSNDSDFLRPAKNSPLTTSGAGGNLPSYVGAMPAEGVEPWDWNKTWKARTKIP